MICGTGYYLSEDFLGKGTVWDMSSGGWRIQGDHQVKIGMRLTLRMDLPEEQVPLEIEQAVVQWISGQDFGVHIQKIHRSQRHSNWNVSSDATCVYFPTLSAKHP
jgi:hypothetical protein